jgi:hypothetical protein
MRCGWAVCPGPPKGGGRLTEWKVVEDRQCGAAALWEGALNLGLSKGGGGFRLRHGARSTERCRVRDIGIHHEIDP